MAPVLRFAKGAELLLSLGYPPTPLDLAALDLPPWAQGPLRCVGLPTCAGMLWCMHEQLHCLCDIGSNPAAEALTDPPSPACLPAASCRYWPPAANGGQRPMPRTRPHSGPLRGRCC